MDKIFLSIVIPVYNGAGTITRCLDSIWGQGLPADKYEVICVDDCSTDNTSEVIKSVQLLHSNLHLYRNETNLRAGGSRNKGVREAKGEYILFIDADDYFHKGALIKVCEYLEKEDLDILMGDFARETASQANDNLIHNFSDRDVLSGRDFLLINSIPYGPCKFVFKKSLMNDNEVLFEEKCCCEDVDWTHRLSLKASKMQYLPILLSHVIINDESQTANEHRYLRPVTEKMFAGFRMYKLAEGYDSEVAERLNSVANLYFSQGVRYMMAVCAPISQKHEAICKYIPVNGAFSNGVKLVRMMPWCFSVFSNMISPLIKVMIKTKRKYAGR